MLDPAFILDPTTVDQYTQLLAPDNLPMNYYLEPTDFSAMAMTRAGTVIFPFLISHAFYMIYNQSCQDGRVRILNFGSNGQVMHEAWLRPFQIGPLTQIHFSLGLHWYELLERPDTLARWNKTYLLIGFNPLSPTYPTLYSIKISLVVIFRLIDRKIASILIHQSWKLWRCLASVGIYRGLTTTHRRSGRRSLSDLRRSS